MKNVKNAYCLIHFACCRDILKVSHREEAELSKKIEKTLYKEINEKLAKEFVENIQDYN